MNVLKMKGEKGSSKTIGKKRECKRAEKEENVEDKGIDVTDLLEDKRIAGKRVKLFNKKGQNVYGSICVFISKDKGANYECETCSKRLKTIGIQKKPIFLIE